MYANAKFFDAAVNAFNKLTPDQRRIRAQLISREGHFKQKSNTVPPFGEGGYYVGFPSNDSLSGSAELSGLQSTWTDQAGLTLSGHIDMKAQADLKLHIDPYIGGGFSTTIGIDGSTRVPLRLSLDARHIDFGNGSSAAVIGPVFECQQFPIKLENSELIQFGIIIYEFIGDEQPSPQIIMSSDALWTQLVAEDREGVLRFDSSYWAGVHVIPVSVIVGAEGYRFFATIEPTLSVGKPLESQFDSISTPLD